MKSHKPLLHVYGATDGRRRISAQFPSFLGLHGLLSSDLKVAGDQNDDFKYSTSNFVFLSHSEQQCIHINLLVSGAVLRFRFIVN
jgi:hypothetical protein